MDYKISNDDFEWGRKHLIGCMDTYPYGSEEYQLAEKAFRYYVRMYRRQQDAEKESQLLKV